MLEQYPSEQILDLLHQPAFCVSEGIITQVNREAQDRQISVGMQVSSLLEEHADAYTTFASGVLYLTLHIGESICHATATATDSGHLFVLDSYYGSDALKALSLASQHLRQQMGAVLAAAQENSGDGKLMKGIYRMQRTLCNMSDLAAIRSKPAPANMLDLGSAVYEIAEKAATLLDDAEIKLDFAVTTEIIHTLADYELLERAIYNLISNAAKNVEKGSTIKLRLGRSKQVATITVEDDGSGIASNLYSSLFSSYLREPSVAGGQQGVGLGMALVQAVAVHHGGTVLVTGSQKGGTRVTMSVAIREGNDTILRSPRRILMDYAGELDHGLLELSDVLPAKLYNK